jgi:hypothetical protein
MSNDVRTSEAGSYVILVAFEVSSVGGRKEAELRLQSNLPRPSGRPDTEVDNWWLDCWWVAEDDRYDGSDNDSAVFVPVGKQRKWAAKVAAHDIKKNHGGWHE